MKIQMLHDDGRWLTVGFVPPSFAFQPPQDYFTYLVKTHLNRSFRIGHF